MANYKLIALAAGMLAAATTTAGAVEVKKSLEVKAAQPIVWGMIGQFCAIKNWHPALADCQQSGVGKEQKRTLVLKDGAKIVERATGRDRSSYSYAIEEGPLPVKNYTATLATRPGAQPGTTAIDWTAKFEANGKSDEEAAKVIEGIFTAGLEGINAKVAEQAAAKEKAVADRKAKLEEIKAKAKAKIEEAKAKAKELKDKAVAKAKELKEKALAKAKEMKEKAMAKAKEMKEKAEAKAKEMKEKAEARKAAREAAKAAKEAEKAAKSGGKAPAAVGGTAKPTGCGAMTDPIERDACIRNLPATVNP